MLWKRLLKKKGSNIERAVGFCGLASRLRRYGHRPYVGRFAFIHLRCIVASTPVTEDTSKSADAVAIAKP
jgi:hypothetical protein